MTVKQISVFVENKPGQLAEFAEVLSEHQIDMRALSMAETRDFGILRIIVDDPYKTACLLKESGYVFSITPVLAVAIPDEPGSLLQVLRLMKEGGINVEYTYAFITRRQDCAYMIFRVEDNDKAVDILTRHDVRLLSQEELNEL